MSETRRIWLHPNAIYHYIHAQAGTLDKAVLECIQNSIDSNSSRVDITIDSTHLRVEDDGRGFQTREELEAWFEPLGFPHEENDRTYGQFGVGRAQLWSFCASRWRTHTFDMDVDIKNRGFDYQLSADLPDIPGLRIDGTFYTPLLTSEVANFERELAELARYAQIPVTVNGHRISQDAAQEKWDVTTDDAYIRMNESEWLAVYNLGVLVRRYAASQCGTGGIVVTRPGVKLAVNVARNDILVTQCAVWKRIRASLQTRSDERVRQRQTRLSPAQLTNLARRFVAKEVAYPAIATTKLIPDITGRPHTLESFSRALGRTQILTTAPLGSRLGERAHTQRLAFVVPAATFERFGARDLKGWVTSLTASLDTSEGRHLRWSIDHATVIDDLATAVPALRDGYDVLKPADLTNAERAAHQALIYMAHGIGRALFQRQFIHARTANREVHIGVSDNAQGWTDGESRIVIERRTLKLMNQGIGGFVGLGNIIVHEYLHDNDDMGSHTHDPEFYEHYHEATCSAAGILNQVVYHGLRIWVKSMHHYRLKVPALPRNHLDLAEKIEREGNASAEE